jgi:hypothetical protein
VRFGRARRYASSPEDVFPLSELTRDLLPL